MRTPLASDLKSRDGTLTRDAGTKNAIIETAGDQSVILKRPGVSDGGNIGTGTSQLLACYNGELKSIVGNTLANLIVVEKTSSLLFEYPTPATGGWAGVTYGASKFVALSNTGVPATSTDGVNWTTHTAINTGALPAGQWQDIAFGNGVFVALYSAFSGDVFTSTDGIAWTPSGVSIINDVLISGDFPHLKFVNGNFFVLTDSAMHMGGAAMASDPTVSDPGLWDVPGISPGYGVTDLYDVDDVEYFSGKYYALTHRQSDRHKKVGSSTDGVTWSGFVAAVPTTRDTGIYERLGVVGGNLVVAGVSSSSNGTTWAESVGLPDGYWTFCKTTFGIIGGKAYLMIDPDAGGFPQVLMTSTDGVTWNTGPSPTNDNQHYGSGSNGTHIISLGGVSNDSVIISASGAPVGISATVDSSVSITAIEPSIQFFSEVSGQAQSQNVMFLRNRKEGWTYDGTTLAKITDPDYPGWSTVTPTSIACSGSTVTVTLAAAVNWQSLSNVIVAGADQAEYNGEHKISVVDSTHVTYQVTGTPATPATGTITVTGGRTTVPGAVYLDGYFFLMDEDAVIYGCELGDVTNWNALNFITANIEPGSGVAIAKTQNYVVALKSWSTEFFYDAGNATGSPLSPVLSAFALIGCASGYSVASIDGKLTFISKTRQKGRSVHVVDGLQNQKISTPDIERILNVSDISDVYSYGIKTSGHVFYVLGLRSANLTLVYDFTSGTWGQWTSLAAKASAACSITSSNGLATVTQIDHGRISGDVVSVSGAIQSAYNGDFVVGVIDADHFTFQVPADTASPSTGTVVCHGYTETYFKFDKYANCAGKDLVIHETNGNLYEVAEIYRTDSTGPILTEARTGKIDSGDVNALRTNSRVELIGNKNGGMAAVRWSNDDRETKSAVRHVDLDANRSRLTRCGSFRRRSYDLIHVENKQMQASALELDIE